ncbi:putative membrane protein [Olavius algarvensis associated proteobacterium Delta 3]|nr:putative membrane protein [Olavius algarvensis associated proteobacterium Delta 3]CAB5128675.1 putative membrane protein [Olavius algarvensis associated proteobacterium Delta 3]
MNKTSLDSLILVVRWLSALALSLIIVSGTSAGARAAEADAKRILKAMSDYMAAQKSISFEFDATLEVVTYDEQKLALASSGTLTLNRPDKIQVTRAGGFADVDMYFDGKLLTLLGKNLNLYTQIEVPGTIDHLIDELKDTYQRPLPAADLLLSNAYNELMRDVVDVKDLGSGVVGGIESDYLGFRTKDVDWQIWIAQGKRPYPCRYVITSKHLDSMPQYTIQIRNWKTGGEVAATDFGFKNSTKAEKVELKDLKGADDLPDHFVKGDVK